MSIEEEIKLINDVWGSESNLLDFIEGEKQKLSTFILPASTSLPEVWLCPSEMASEVAGIPMGRGCAGRYEPDNGQSGIITLFPAIAISETEIRIALAHELVHHWESTSGSKAGDFPYPEEVDTVIQSIFSDPDKERRWRSGHSKTFIAKAFAVARLLDIPFDGFLIYRKRNTKK